MKRTRPLPDPELKGKAHGSVGNGGKLTGVQSRGYAKIRCLGCLAAVLLAGLLGCGGHGLRVAPGHDSDAVAPVPDAIAADLSHGPLDSGGSGTTTDTVTSSLEAGVAGQKDASADTGTDTKIEAGLPDAGVVDLAAGPDHRVAAGADTSARADAAIDAVLAEAGVVDVGVPDAPADAPQVPDVTRSPDAGPSLDACVPLACSNRMTCVSDYCGTIGDGCGGTLHCPTTCPNALWSCVDGVCKSGLETHCVPLSCITYAGNYYCGDIYDGCGGTVHCGACARAGWNLPEWPLHRAAFGLHTNDLRRPERRELLRDHLQCVRWQPRLRDDLPKERLALRQRFVQGHSAGVHATHLQSGRRPVLRSHWRRVRRHPPLRPGVL